MGLGRNARENPRQEGQKVFPKKFAGIYPVLLRTATLQKGGRRVKEKSCNWSIQFRH